MTLGDKSPNGDHEEVIQTSSHGFRKRCKQYKAARHPTICDVINDVKLYPTVQVYCRIYSHKYLTLSNQTPRN